MLQESMSWKAGYVSEHATGVDRNKAGSEHATGVDRNRLGSEYATGVNGNSLSF